MKSLVLTVSLFCLMPVLQAQDDLPFLSEDRNMSGIWYQKAIVNDLNITKRRPIEIQKFPFTVRALQKGNLDVTFTYMRNGECVLLEFLMEKTEKPGIFKAFWDTMLIHIYELPVTDYYVFYNEYKYIDRKYYVGELIGKDPNSNHQALEEFKKFAQWKGFLPENIIVPEQRDICVSEVRRGVSQNCKSAANSVSNA